MTDHDTNPDVRLAPGYGIVPEHQRNRGFDKLGYAPGEGGIRMTSETRVGRGNQSTVDFLSAVAAGADPQQLARDTLAKSSRRPRRTQEDG